MCVSSVSRLRRSTGSVSVSSRSSTLRNVTRGSMTAMSLPPRVTHRHVDHTARAASPPWPRPSREGAPMAQIEVERDGHVMVVTMNRPKRKNAMTLTMFALHGRRVAGAQRERRPPLRHPHRRRGQLLVGHGPARDGRRRRSRRRHRRAGPHEGGPRLRLPRAPEDVPARRSRSSPRSRASPSPAAPRSCRAPTSASPARARASACPRRAGRSTRWAARRCACGARSPTPSRPTSSSPASTSWRRRRKEIGLDRPRRARRPGARQGARDRRRRSRRTARSRSRRSSRRCTRPST